MAQFRVGDKARIVGAMFNRDLIGEECVILLGLHNCDTCRYPGRPLVYRISVPAHPNQFYEWWTVLPEYLAPLTDPSADAFIARIKKLGTEPVNDAPKVTVREGK